jgi:hypothetical protein
MNEFLDVVPCCVGVLIAEVQEDVYFSLDRHTDESAPYSRTPALISPFRILYEYCNSSENRRLLDRQQAGIADGHLSV